ncbi:hypothetical protein [Lacrimispora sp.]
MRRKVAILVLFIAVIFRLRLNFEERVTRSVISKLVGYHSNAGF